jgi:hypothetical protein
MADGIQQRARNDSSPEFVVCGAQGAVFAIPNDIVNM